MAKGVAGIMAMLIRAQLAFPNGQIGAFVQALAIIIFVINLIWSARKGKIVGNDPWDAWTLEWTTSSPPPDYNYAKIPEVRSRSPLWDLKHPGDPDWKFE
jgi:cytochrome c oxidase subunit 1